jgi:hypothetical protein
MTLKCHKRMKTRKPRQRRSPNDLGREQLKSLCLQKIQLASEEASDYVTSHLNGGGARKLSTEDAIQAR